jgi:hypothetical protein
MNTKEISRALNAKIDSLGKRLATAEADIQSIGLACLEHLDKHGDTMPLNRLINVLRRGQHAAFMEWCLAFGKVAKNMDKVTKEQQPVLHAKNRTTDIEGATAKPWFEFADSKADAIKKAFDLQGAVMALIKKAAAAGTDHELLVAIGALANIKPEKVPASVMVPAVEAALV